MPGCHVKEAALCVPEELCVLGLHVWAEYVCVEECAYRCLTPSQYAVSGVAYTFYWDVVGGCVVWCVVCVVPSDGWG